MVKSDLENGIVYIIEDTQDRKYSLSELKSIRANHEKRQRRPVLFLHKNAKINFNPLKHDKKIWITDRPEQAIDTEAIYPKLENIFGEIESFFKTKYKKPVLYWEAVENIISYRGDMFDSFMQVLRRLVDFAHTKNNSISLIPLNTEVLEKTQLNELLNSGIEYILHSKEK